jgi:hypothetical protein
MKPYTPVSFAVIALLTGCATLPVSTLPEQLDLNRYHAVNVAPVLFTPEIAGAIPDAERASLERDFGAALKEGLAPSFQSVQPATGVVRIEVTITELNASSPTVNLITTALLFVPFDTGGVAFDARFYDGASREPFAQSNYRRTSTPLELKGSFRRYGHATRALRDWSEGLMKRLVGTQSRSVAKSESAGRIGDLSN